MRRYSRMLSPPRGCPLARLGADLDAFGIVGTRGALHDAGDGPELPAHLGHHLQRRLTHALDRHGGEPVGNHRADQQAAEDARVEQRGLGEGDLGALDVGAEQGLGSV